jgi:cyclic pyranopterin phosphate synthase
VSLVALDARLVDRFGRVHDDLRISITDRCNLRCVYCMTEDQVFQPRGELLSLSEIVRVGQVARALGVRAVRITGGEPLVRHDVVDIVAGLASLGFEDVALTTNGTRLSRLARPLADAGLKRVNVSCDSLRPERFPTIRRRGELAAVLEAMEVAEAAGLAPLKVNVVLIAGVNDDEILDFAAFARSTGRIVRFIEFMPLDAPGSWSRDHVVPAQEVLEVIGARWPVVALKDPSDPAPAERFAFADGQGEIGVIASVTRPFCATCNRLRVTADGAVRNCLFSDDERPLRRLLREGASDEELAAVLVGAVEAKRAGHGIGEPTFIRSRRSMSMIGG